MKSKFKLATAIFVMLSVLGTSLFLSGCSNKEETTSDTGCIEEGQEGEIFPGSPSCCEGLSGLSCDKPDENGNCSTECSDTFICADCGDGECSDGENKCNCPRDCE